MDNVMRETGIGAAVKEEPLVSVSGLTVGYGGVEVLRGITFTVMRGEVFFILGESGSGKSTLLKNIVGLTPAKAGSIRVCGVEMTQARENEVDEVRSRIGILFQGGALLGSLTVEENVSLPLIRHAGIPQDLLGPIVRVKLGMVNLSGYQNHLPSELSGGMKNRVGLARALALDPEVIFLDEPTSGLDPINATEIDGLIRRLNRAIGTTMVIVSQDMRSVMSIGDRAVLLDKDTKGVAAIGTPDQLKQSPPGTFADRFFNGRVT